ncbi:MAG: SDR family NAD(P)-dependent oxidoreductase [Elusimicrobia bacterium]|nr:SDR family NAD(P)-dependent oxidoreductase [Candidatus Obscuribacterium magneticum]
MLILITGGSSGIGKHLAGEYLRQGDSVIIIADGKEKLEKARLELASISPNVWSYVCDVGDKNAVPEMARQVSANHGCPDILVNNAGFATYRTFDQTPYDEMERLIDVNLKGVLRCTHCFLPAMKERRSGHIVNIASVGGIVPITPCATYGSAKYGLVGISTTLQYELKSYNIHVHLVCPGRVKTDFFNHETFRNRTQRSEMERYIPIEKVSKMIMSAVKKGRFYTVIPWLFRIQVWIMKVAPFLVEPYFRRQMLERIRLVRLDEERLKRKKENE